MINRPSRGGTSETLAPVRHRQPGASFNVCCQRQDRVHDAESDLVVDTAGGVVGCLYDAAHHLVRGQTRESGTHQGRYPADERRGIACTPQRNCLAGFRRIWLGIDRRGTGLICQTHDRRARRRHLHPWAGNTVRQNAALGVWAGVYGPDSEHQVITAIPGWRDRG